MPGIKILIACQFVIIRLFKTLIRTVVTCGCEMWKLSLSLSLSLKKKRGILNSFERNIFRPMFTEREREREGGVMWIIKYNEQLPRKCKNLALNSRHYKVPDM